MRGHQQQTGLGGDHASSGQLLGAGRAAAERWVGRRTRAAGLQGGSAVVGALRGPSGEATGPGASSEGHAARQAGGRAAAVARAASSRGISLRCGRCFRSLSFVRLHVNLLRLLAAGSPTCVPATTLASPVTWEGTCRPAFVVSPLSPHTPAGDQAMRSRAAALAALALSILGGVAGRALQDDAPELGVGPCTPTQASGRHGGHISSWLPLNPSLPRPCSCT